MCDVLCICLNLAVVAAFQRVDGGCLCTQCVKPHSALGMNPYDGTWVDKDALGEEDDLCPVALVHCEDPYFTSLVPSCSLDLGCAQGRSGQNIAGGAWRSGIPPASETEVTVHLNGNKRQTHRRGSHGDTYAPRAHCAGAAWALHGHCRACMRSCCRNPCMPMKP